MGISPTPTAPNSQQSTLIFTTTVAVVGVLAGVLLTLGYGEAISTLVEGRTRTGKSRGTAGVDGRATDEKREGKVVEARRKRGMVGLGDGEDRESVRGVESKRNVKEGIEGCIGNTPLIRIVSFMWRACIRGKWRKRAVIAVRPGVVSGGVLTKRHASCRVMLYLLQRRTYTAPGHICIKQHRRFGGRRTTAPPPYPAWHSLVHHYTLTSHLYTTSFHPTTSAFSSCATDRTSHIFHEHTLKLTLPPPSPTEIPLRSNRLRNPSKGGG